MPRQGKHAMLAFGCGCLILACCALLTASLSLRAESGGGPEPVRTSTSEVQILKLPGGRYVTAGADAPIDADGHALQMPGEVILKLSAAGRPQLTEATKNDTLQRLAFTVGVTDMAPVFPRGKPESLGRTYRARFPRGESVLDVCRRLGADPGVEWAEPNYIYRTSATLPDDPEFGQQWSLHNVGQAGGHPDADVDAPEAWDVTTGDPSVVIAIIDTGVNYNHPDLAGRIWSHPGESGDGKETDGLDNDGNGYIDDIHGWDFVSVDAAQVDPAEDPGPPDNDPIDLHGHGTHVSGIAAAAGSNGVGIAGVAWQCRIMPVRAGFKDPAGIGLVPDADAAAAIVYAADNGASVINMSWGGSGDSQLVREAIEYARSRDVCLVAAAGNESSSGFSYPAAYPGVLSVAASDRNDAKAGFSNFGPAVDLIAPGVTIHSTWIDGGYRDASGTSMASPLVAGIAALVRSRFPDRTADAVCTTLISSTDPFVCDTYVGTGRANASAAVRLEQVCAASIASPSPGTTVNGVIHVVGSADGPAFAGYTLAYATGVNAPSFITFVASPSPVANADLGTLDTASLPEGPLLLRLTVTSTNGSISVCQALIEVSRSVWFHAGGEICSAPKPVKLAGGRGYGIVFGTSEGKVYLLSPDGQVVPGWPISTGSLVGYTSAAVADLDGNGAEDIVLHGNNTLEAYAQDGSALAGWPKGLILNLDGNSPCGSPVIHDLDGDGDLEVLVGHLYWTLAFHHNGTLMDGWPIIHPQAFGPALSTPAVADLDEDGDAEICIKMYGGNGEPADVYLVHHDGSPVANWPKLGLEASHISSPVLADIDNDGHRDVVTSLHASDSASGNSVRLHVWKLDGTPVAGFPVTGSWNTAPINNAVADIDADGLLEIFVGTQQSTPPFYAIHAWRHDGTPLPGQWPRSAALCATSSSPIIADLDGNRNEILMSVGGCYESDAGELEAWSFDGSPAPGWPKPVPSPVGSSAPLVIDADRDGIPEIYVGGQNGYLYRYLGSPAPRRDPPQWNQAFHDARNTNAPTAVADFDSDGDVDTGDLDHFSKCASGPMIPAPACATFDLDADGDVDQEDFATFQRCFSGTHRPAKPNCGR